MLYKIGEYFLLVLTTILVIGVWRFGDWRNWRKYYPTILFIISVNLCVTILTYNHTLWHFHKALFIPNHTLGDIFMKFTNFPFMILLYLSRYPYKSRFFRQFVYIAIWVAVFSLVEFVFLFTKLMTYHNNWNFGWSVLLWCAMFPLIRIHHTRPVWAWFICLGFTVLAISYFEIPITKLK